MLVQVVDGSRHTWGLLECPIRTVICNIGKIYLKSINRVVPSSGQSYNPTFAAHQELLHQAVHQENKKVEKLKVEGLAKGTNFPLVSFCVLFCDFLYLFTEY